MTRGDWTIVAGRICLALSIALGDSHRWWGWVVAGLILVTIGVLDSQVRRRAV